MSADDFLSSLAPCLAERASQFSLRPAHPHRLFRERLEPIAEYHARLLALYEASPFGKPESLADLIYSIAVDGAQTSPRKPSPAIFESCVRCVQYLVGDNELSFDFPSLEPSLIHNDNYALPLRRRLQELEPVLAHHDRIVKTFSAVATATLAAIVNDYLPDAAFSESDTAVITVPLLTLVARPHELVEKIIVTFIAGEPHNTVEPDRYAFWVTRYQLFENLLAASGLSLDQLEKDPHRLVLPTSSRLPAVQLAATYLKHSPFAEFLSTPIPFAIPRRAFRAHGCIFGPADHGKTQTLQAIIAGFLNEPDPPALFIMDSMGAMLKKLERLALFDGRLKDRLIVLDPAGANPPRLNFFKLSGGTPPQQMELLFYLFKALDQSLTARQRTAVTFLAQLMQKIDGTLDDLRRVCEAKKPLYAEAINALPDIARDFFFNAFYKPDALMTQTKQQIAARLYTLAATPIFSMFSAKENTFNAFECIQQKKIVLVNTDRLSLGDEGSAIFGRFVLAQCLAAAFARAPIPEEERHLAVCIVDEAKAYFDEQTERFLSDARQFGLGLFFGTQYVAQLSEGVRRAVYGNTAIKLIGPIEYSDRVSLAREMGTTPEFIGAMRSYDESHTEWAAHVRTSNMTPSAIKLTVPFGILERMPKSEYLPKTVLSEPASGAPGIRAPRRAAERDAPSAALPHPPATPPDEPLVKPGKKW